MNYEMKTRGINHGDGDITNNVLKVQIISIALDQFVRQLVFEELIQFVGVDKCKSNNCHFGKKEY